MEWRPLRRHSIHDIDTIPPDVISDQKKPSIQFCSAEKRRYESAQSIGENRENAAFRLKFTFASLNLQVNAQPWRQNSLNLRLMPTLGAYRSLASNGEQEISHA